MKSAYQQAKSYAYFLDFEKYRDIVHDAYVRYFEKTGKNLFDEHRWMIRAVIKNTWISSFAKEKFIWRGESYRKVFVSVAEDTAYGEDMDNRQYGVVVVAEGDPEQEMIFEEYMAELDRCLSTVSKHAPKNLVGNRGEIFKYILQGYGNREIAEITGFDPKTVTKTLSILKDGVGSIIKSKMIDNPFNGSKTKVKDKKLTEHQWNERKDKDQYEMEVDHEWAILYRHKETGEGYLVRKKNPVQSEDYIKNLVDKEKKVTLPKFKEQ